MAERILIENRRQIEQNERAFAEGLLGKSYDVRVYQRHGNVARGTVAVSCDGGTSVHTAYVILSDEISADTVSAAAVGVLICKKTESISLVLCCDAERIMSQHEIAEAVDFWESDNCPKIYCLHEKSCGAVVYTGDGKDRRYLIIRMNLGHCGLPKGHIEKFESERETAVREILEETGVSVTLDPDFRKSVVYSLTSRTTKESVYFLGRFDGGDVKIQEAEVSAYKLCSYEEARKYITYENDRMIIDAAQELLNSK